MFPQNPMYTLATTHMLPVVYDVAPDNELVFMLDMLNIMVAILAILVLEYLQLDNEPDDHRFVP
jgi:hypothetical protein